MSQTDKAIEDLPKLYFANQEDFLASAYAKNLVARFQKLFS